MKYLYCIFLLLIVGCGSKNDEPIAEEVKTSLYPDDTYCAAITYYNPNTGTKHTYTLNVEVENNEMIKIYWGNGGWLDDSHFAPVELDNNGECSFRSDKGNEYGIKITGIKCTDTDNPSDEDENKAFPLTIQQCAAAMQMTETELQQYENDFHTNRTDVITEEMCASFNVYISEIRKIHGKMDAMNVEIENGHIEDVYIMNIHDGILCQQILVKKKGVYYWLEVQGLTKTTMGTIQFDHNTNNWQNVFIKEGPESINRQGFSMRIMDYGRDRASIKEKMYNYCHF